MSNSTSKPTIPPSPDVLDQRAAREVAAGALHAGVEFIIEHIGYAGIDRVMARLPRGGAAANLVMRVLGSRAYARGAPPAIAVIDAESTEPARAPAKPSDTAKYLDENQLCAELGISPVTATKWRREAKGPPFIRVGRLIRYARTAVDDWIAGRTVGRSAAPKRG